MGKGRTIAAILIERDMSAPSAPYGVWVTTNTTLLDVAARDIDIVAGDNAAVRMQQDGALLLCTYGTLRDPAACATIVERLRAADKGGTIVFDEAHAAISERSAVGKAVRTLQRQAPEAGVVYSTATAASQVSQLGYMERLGMWGRSTGHQFATHAQFASAMKARGPAALELLSLDLKRRGVYIARALAASDAPARMVAAPLTQDQQDLYDSCCAFGPRGRRYTKCHRQLITALKGRSLSRAPRSIYGRGAPSFSRSTRARCARAVQIAHYEKKFCARPTERKSISPQGCLDTIDRLRDALQSYGVVELSGALQREMRRAVGAFQRGDARVPATSAASQGCRCTRTVGWEPGCT